MGSVIASGNFSGNGDGAFISTYTHTRRDYTLAIPAGEDIDGGTLQVEAASDVNGTSFGVLRSDDGSLIRLVAVDRAIAFSFTGFGLRVSLSGSTSPDLDWVIMH